MENGNPIQIGKYESPALTSNPNATDSPQRKIKGKSLLDLTLLIRWSQLSHLLFFVVSRGNNQFFFVHLFYFCFDFLPPKRGLAQNDVSNVHPFRYFWQCLLNRFDAFRICLPRHLSSNHGLEPIDNRFALTIFIQKVFIPRWYKKVH